MRGEREPPVPGDPARHLREWIADNRPALRGILRSKVAPLCLAHQDAGEVADELLSELVADLLKTVDRYDPTRPPHAWATGFAHKIALRWREREISRGRHEAPPLTTNGNGMSSLADFLAAARDDPEAAFVGDSWVGDVLARLSAEDRAIIVAAVLEDRKIADLAQEWGVSAGSLRTRLCRALKSLRATLPVAELFVSTSTDHRAVAGARVATGVNQ